MNTAAIAIVLGFACPAQDDPEAAVKELAGKISREGISGRLAEAAATDWGARAIVEKIDFLLGARTARFERDPLGYYEDHLFRTDTNGDLHLYAEHQEEMRRLAARMARAADFMKDFQRRSDALAGRIAEDTDFDRRAKKAWADPEFRVAFFHRHPAELRELTAEDLAEQLVLRGLARGADGKLRVGGPFADELRARIESTNGTLESMKAYEKAYLQEAAKVKDAAARATVTSDAGIVFVMGRLLRQAAEGGAESIGGITEGDEDKNKPPTVSFNLELDELAPLVKQAEELSSGLKAALEKAAADVAGAGDAERNVLDFARSDRARLLLAERAMAMRKDQQAKAEEIFSAVVADGFEEKDGKLRVKKGRYLDDQKAESLEALDGELNNVIEEFNGAVRQDFDRLAERCVDEPIVAMLENREATFLVVEHRDAVIAGLVDAMKKQGLDVFVKAYLTKQGESYAVRPDRAKRVEAILRRAAEIKKEMDKAPADK